LVGLANLVLPAGDGTGASTGGSNVFPGACSTVGSRQSAASMVLGDHYLSGTMGSWTRRLRVRKARLRDVLGGLQSAKQSMRCAWRLAVRKVDCFPVLDDSQSSNTKFGFFRLRSVLTLLGRGPCASLTWTFSYSILVRHGLTEP